MRTPAENKALGVGMPEYTYPSETEAAQGKLLHEALEIHDFERDIPEANARLTLRQRLLIWDIEESGYLAAAIERAKRIAVERALNGGV